MKSKNRWKGLALLLSLVMLLGIMMPAAYADEFGVSETNGAEQMILLGAEGGGNKRTPAAITAADTTARSGSAIYWTDNLTAKPDGFVADSDGNVEISSPEGLAWLSVLTSGLNDQTVRTFGGITVTLTDDIDLSGKRWTPIGRYEVELIIPPIPPLEVDNSSPFKGTFDGNGHTIKNLKMSTFPDDIKNRYYGLFSLLREGEIKNLHLIDVDMDIADSKRVAALVGKLESSTVENCTVDGNIAGNQVCGIAYDGDESSSISRCTFNGSFSSEGSSYGICDSIDGTIDRCYVNASFYSNNSAGICRSLHGTIDQCYVNASFYNANQANGICQNTSGTISNCYTIGSIDATNAYVGGVCGKVDSGGTVENCYSTMTVKGGHRVGGITAQVSSGAKSVKGCVALNDIMTAEGSTGSTGTGSSVGRVIGDELTLAGDAEIKMNFAYSGMKVYSRDEDGEGELYLRGLLADECMRSKVHGEDIAAADLAEGWPVSDWDTDIWNFEDGKLPTLKNISAEITQTGEIPDYISEASEEDWNITAFDELTIDTPEVTLNTSAEDAAAALPDELYAIKDGGTAVYIPAITWESEDYDGSTVGEYTFTAVLPDGYAAEADLPAVKVNVVLKYTVTLDTNGADEIEALAADNGSLINAPDDPVREGFNFGGWYKDESYTEAWDFDNDAVTSSMTLYAKWTIDGEPDYTAAESGAQEPFDISALGFSNAAIVSISNVDGYTTYAVIGEGKIDFYGSAGEYIIADSGKTVSSESIFRFNQNEGLTPIEQCYKGTDRGTAEEPVTMLGSFFVKDASEVTENMGAIDITFRILNLIAGYDVNGTADYGTTHCVAVEDRDTSTGRLKASFTIDGNRIQPCNSAGWFRSPREYGIALNPSDTLIEEQFDKGYSHPLYVSADYPERRAAALETLKAVREDDNKVLMLHTQMRDFPGPVTFKIDVSGYFEDGDTVNINYLLGAGKGSLYHGIHIEDDYALALEPTYIKNNTSAVVTDGYITVDMYNGGYFELVKEEDDTTETKYVAEFVTNHLIKSYDTLYPSTIYPQILDADSGYKVTKPDDPEPEGESDTFGGWYTDKGCTEAFDFDTAITDHIMIYAKWTDEDGNEPGGPGGSDTEPPEGTYTVTFVTGNDPDTGRPNATIDSQYVEEGERAEDPDFFDSGYGYLVLGWYTDSDLTEEYDFDDPVKSDVTLYPKWMRYILKDDLKKEGGSGSRSDPYLVHLADSRQSKIAWKALNKLAGKSEWWKVYVTEDSEEDGDVRYQWVFNCEGIKRFDTAQPYYTDVDLDEMSSNSVQADFIWRTAIEGTVYVSIDVSRYFDDNTEIEVSYVEDSCDGKVVHTDVEDDDWVNTHHYPDTYYTTDTAVVEDDFITLELTHGGSYLLTSNEPITDSTGSEETSKVTVHIRSKVEAEEGAAAVSVTNTEIDSAVKSAAKKNADLIVISPKVTGEFDKLSAQFNKRDFKKIINNTASDLMLETDLGNVVVPKEALAKIADTEGSKVVINIEKASGEAVSVEIQIDDKKAEDIGDIVIAIPVENAGSGMIAVLVGEDGSEEIIKKSVLKGDEMFAAVKSSSTVKLIDRSKSFNDVDDSFWGKDAVEFAASRELFQGVSETEFGTGEAMTRSMLVTVLHRLENTPEGGDAGFNDVDQDSWYAEAVAWASENEIVTGTGGSFNPEKNITRQQIAVILYRYAEYMGVDADAQGDIAQFSDSNQVSDWASEAMGWMAASGLIKGKDGNALDPAGDATRAEVAVMLQRFVSKILN